MEKDIILDAVDSAKEAIEHYKISSFCLEMSKITDDNLFEEIMNSKTFEEKLQIEKGLCCIVGGIHSASPSELKFVKLYHQYLFKLLNDDPREYYTNYYCSRLLSNAFLKAKTIDDLKKIKFINGLSLDEIDDIVTQQYNKIISKIQNGEEVDIKDKIFVEEFFLILANEGTIYKEVDAKKDVMYDIVDYFEKYPIQDLSNGRNIQLSILSSLCKEMIKFSKNCCIQFNKSNILDGNVSILGLFSSINGIPVIKINKMDKFYNSKLSDFLEKMFTLFHEVRHMEQDLMLDDFTNEVQEIFELETQFTKNNRSFYNKYHDSFLIERDADEYAAVKLIENYCEMFPDEVLDVITKKAQRKRIDWLTFHQMELEESSKLGMNLPKKR